MSKKKTTWERLKSLVESDDDPVDEFAMNEDGVAFRFVCGELDKANRRIAELDAMVREMATGKRNG